MRAIPRRNMLVPSLLALVLLGAPLALAAPAEAAPADIYASAANWVCRPDKGDVCDGRLNATVVQADGTMTVERWAPATNAPVDCFYVYPTASWDAGANSDRIAGAWEEIAATRIQAARFGSACRVFAPIYRSITSTWLVSAYFNVDALGEFPEDLFAVAYADVVAAWHHYLSVDNGGRGFVLFGHSQGAELLSRLFTEEIAPDPTVRSRLVSALLIGLPSDTHPAQSVLPSCTGPTQTGCHVAYTSFRATSPPDPDSIFAQSPFAHDCTNPAALGGGRAPLRSYFPTAGFRWQTTGRFISTPFVTLPGLIEGECVSGGGQTYLSITVDARPADPRTDDIPGDLLGTPPGRYGLHLSDIQLAQGDLIQLVAQQAAAYQSGR
jgi:hypothetical protein